MPGFCRLSGCCRQMRGWLEFGPFLMDLVLKADHPRSWESDLLPLKVLQAVSL